MRGGKGKREITGNKYITQDKILPLIIEMKQNVCVCVFLIHWRKHHTIVLVNKFLKRRPLEVQKKSRSEVEEYKPQFSPF